MKLFCLKTESEIIGLGISFQPPFNFLCAYGASTYLLFYMQYKLWTSELADSILHTVRPISKIRVRSQNTMGQPLCEQNWRSSCSSQISYTGQPKIPKKKNLSTSKVLWPERTVWTVNDVLSRSIPFYWVAPYPYIWVNPYPFIEGMDQLIKRVWIDSRRHWRSTLYLQPHYGNGVFGNVYLSAGQN